MRKVQVANAPCSWGVIEFDLHQRAQAYARVLDEMASAGYAGTELGDWGFMPTEPNTLKAELKARNLSMLAAFVSVELCDRDAHQAGVESALKRARLLSGVSESPFIVLADHFANNPARTNNAGRITPDLAMTGGEWQAFSEGCELIARTVLDETGVKTVFHHHCGSFIETPSEIERLLQSTNPLLIGLCLDTGHYTFGGGDAVEGFKKHADRIWHVHFKDVDAKKAAQSSTERWDYSQSVENGIFCELGQGTVDFGALVSQLEKANYHGWIVVEQDMLPGMGAPVESAMRSRAYLQSLGL